MTERARDRWSTLDATDRPLLWTLEPMQPGDAAYHRDELVLYWPRVAPGLPADWRPDRHDP